MELHEAEEKLENMPWDSIVKSYCNKVNDIERLHRKVLALEASRRYDVSGKNRPDDYIVCSHIIQHKELMK